VFFPDPWPKKRHHKRRLLDPGFLDILAGSLKPNGLLHVATDWDDYANQILASVDNNPNLINQAGVGHFSERPAYRSQTKYEIRGLRLGHTVNDIVTRRKP
jgi:tRNA (guanine-N7-)-methyltransferase